MNNIKKRCREEYGVTAIEYGLTATIAGATTVGTELNSVFRGLLIALLALLPLAP